MGSNIPVIAVVAPGSGYGKTELIAGLVERLSARGLRVSLLKHASMKTPPDKGKDTWRLREAGAALSALLTGGGLAAYYIPNSSLDDALRTIGTLGADIIICEGFKESDLPKIVIAKPGDAKMVSTLSSVLAVVAREGPIMGVPVPVLRFDADEVTDFISRFCQASKVLVDPFGRSIRGLRISLTQRCNLNCPYCHHEGESGAPIEMTADEVLRTVRIARSLGIRRVKYTGGEPLMRGDLPDIIRGTVSMELEDVAITTNGSLLGDAVYALAEAGLRRLNVSLPSLRPEVYHSLTGGSIQDVLEGISSARRAGMDIKIDAVIMRGINEGEVDDLIRLVGDLGGSLQLIELEDLRLDASFFRRHHQDLSGIEQRLAAAADRVVERSEMNRRRLYMFGRNSVEVVRPINNPHFCSNCTRLRVTSDGKLKPCLMRQDNLVDLLGPMRSGCSDDDLRGLFLRAVGLRAPYYPRPS